MIWVGDLNYRIGSLGVEEANGMVDAGSLAALLEVDQLNVERAGGRAFAGFEVRWAEEGEGGSEGIS